MTNNTKYSARSGSANNNCMEGWAGNNMGLLDTGQSVRVSLGESRGRNEVILGLTHLLCVKRGLQ